MSGSVTITVGRKSVTYPPRKQARERVFVLAASIDQFDLFARDWVNEREGRRRSDAIYLSEAKQSGYLITASDRIVGVEGYWRHPKADRIQADLYRTLAKTGLAPAIESVAL